MQVYRIAKDNHPEIDGFGGLLYPGRWHEKGNRVVYAAQTRSLAAFETLVHISKTKLLENNLILITINIPDDASILDVPASILCKGWNGYAYVPSIQQYGTQFLREKKHLMLKVPSAIIRQEYNYVINPLHEQFISCKIMDISPFVFDGRLFEPQEN
jgi:RES domain-containing protein